MKTNLRNLCLLLAVVGAGCLTLGIALLTNVAGAHVSLEGHPVQTDKAVAAAGLAAIKVDSVSTEVIWRPSPDGQLRARLTGQTTGETPTLDVTRAGDKATVAVRYPRQSFLSFGQFANNLALELYVPAKRWRSVEIGTVSGDVQLGALETGDFRFHSVSGELDSPQLTVAKAEVSSTSGDLTVASFTGEGRFSTVSGEIEVACTQLTGNLKLHTTSGEVQLDLPPDARFNLEARSTSGEIKSAFPITIAGGAGERHRVSGTVGGGGPLVELETVSGNLDLF
ncbi:MAG: DUF4097 family beta strand repeat-containing protein [Chitinophagales bacterium]